MAVKLHVCANTWVKIEGHPCWRVRKALDEAGVDYAVVRGPVMRSKRAGTELLSGQRLYPVIEFEDGSVYREQSKEMAARIRAGKLMEGRGVEDATPEQSGHLHGDGSTVPGVSPPAS